MSKVFQEIDLDVAGPIKGLERMAALVGDVDSSLNRMNNAQRGAFKEPEASTRSFNKELAEIPQNFFKTEAAVKKAQAELKRLDQVFDKLEKSQKDFTKSGDYDDLQKKIDGVKGKIKDLGGTIDKTGKQAKGSFGGLKGVLGEVGSNVASAFAVGAILNWAQQGAAAILNVTAEFQKFEAVLTTSLGSNSAAERALNMIQDFAKKTPYSVAELTDSYVKLASRGIRPTTKDLTSLGDFASSSMKSMDQLIEATLDAMSGQNERLREFNITAEKHGKTTAFTYKGVTTEVENTSEAVKNYLIGLGELEGVTGSMANVSETLTGQLSNLGDSVDQLFLTLGNQNGTVMSGFLDFLGSTLDFLIEISSTTDQLAAKNAAPEVTKFAEQIETDLTKIAASAKANGQDIKTALEEQTATIAKELEAQQKLAQKGVDPYEKGWVNALNKKDAEAAKTKLEIVKGQIAALEDAKRFVLEDAAKKQNQTEAALSAAGDKARAEADARKVKALADLYKELENLEKQAASARLNMINKNSKAYLKAVLDSELKAIEEIENNIKEQQAKAGLAVGLSQEQQAQINALMEESSKKYFDGLHKLQEEEQNTILELQKESDGKELEQLTRKYDQRIRAAREAGQEEVAVALETAAKLEVAALAKNQALSRLDTQESISIELIKTELPEGLDNSVDIERARQQAILDVQIEFAKKRLALMSDDMTDEGILRQLQLKNTISAMEAESQELEKQSGKFSLQKMLGLDDKQMAAVEGALNYSLGQLQDFVAESVALREREVEALKNKIDEKERELEREIDYNELGFASNVQTRRDELEELKRQREKALREQEKAQRRQALLDTAMQAGNLVTASAELYAVMAPLGPFGIAAAIGLIATMFASFAASKARAMQAATVPTYGGGGEGRLIKGPSHSAGGIDVVENRSGRRIANIEGGENFYVTNKKSTDKYWNWLEAINKNDNNKLSDLSLDFLLNGTGVLTPVKELPQQLQALQVNAKTSTQQGTRANDPQIKEISRKLSSIIANTKPVPQIYENENYRVERFGNTTRTIRKENPEQQ